MSYQIVPVSGGFVAKKDERIIKTTFISEYDFLLVISLTSCANLVILYRTGNAFKHEKFSIAKYFAQPLTVDCAPAAVAITPDASVIVVVLSNLDVLLLPLKCLMKIYWGGANAVIRRPLRFSFKNFSECFQNGCECNYCPTSAFCFDSLLSRTYLVVGDKTGTISIINLNIQSLCARLSSGESIQTVQYYLEKKIGAKYILVTHFDKSQFLIPLETTEKALHETLALTAPSNFKCLSNNGKCFYYLQNFCWTGGENCGSMICAFDKTKFNITLYSSINSVAKHELMVPLNDYKLIEYTEKTLFLITESLNEIFVNLHFLSVHNEETVSSEFVRIPWESSLQTSSSKQATATSILNMLPLAKNDRLDECLLIAETGLFWLQPQKSIYSTVADFLATKSFFSSLDFKEIAVKLSVEPFSFYESILLTILMPETRASNAYLDGFLSLGHDITKLMEILSKYNEADLLLPFLLLRCEKNSSDSTVRQLLFNAYISKLGKLNQSLKAEEAKLSTNKGMKTEDEGELLTMTDLHRQKETLEHEIRHFLIKFNNSTSTIEVLSLLMRHSLWSCVAVVLCQDPASNSLAVIRFLSEMTNWRDTTNLDSLIKCLSLLQWPSTAESIIQILVTKMISLLPHLNLINHIQILVNIADLLLKKSLNFAFALYLISSIRLLSLVVESNLNSCNGNSQGVKLSSGSNCSTAILDDGNVVFWGEFSASTIRLASDARKKEKSQKKTVEPKTISYENNILNCKTTPAKSNQNCLKPSTSSCVLIPKIVNLPLMPTGVKPDNFKVKSVACGTEHVILLTIDGCVMSWGHNRYGQCGNGTNWPIKEPVLITKSENGTDFGLVDAIFAGHYHSALINKNGEVWMWGWGMYGQLATGNNTNQWFPKKICALSNFKVVNVCLGYAHTLFQLANGTVLGCGATSNGQLGVDPKNIKEKFQHALGQTSAELKIFYLYKLTIPAPVLLLSSNYFHGVAICSLVDFKDKSLGSPRNCFDSTSNQLSATESKNVVIYEWGECPQTVRMRTFLMQRLRSGLRREKRAQDDMKIQKEQLSEEFNCTKNALAEKTFLPASSPALQRVVHKRLSQSTLLTTQVAVELNADSSSACVDTVPSTSKNLPNEGDNFSDEGLRDYFKIRQRFVWTGGVSKGSISQLSAGFNHSAFVTTCGELYTWGKAMEMQLGHGDKKDKETPTLVAPPPPYNTIKWAHVNCARNYTVAVSVEGHVYVWGRNDKSQLGVGALHKNGDAASKVRRVIFKPKSNTGSPVNAAAVRVVELPANDANIGAITRMHGVETLVNKIYSPIELERLICKTLTTSDQYTLNSVSKYFMKNSLAFLVKKFYTSSSPIDNDKKLSETKLKSILMVLFCVADIHILAGDLVYCVDVLSLITESKTRHDTKFIKPLISNNKLCTKKSSLITGFSNGNNTNIANAKKKSEIPQFLWKNYKNNLTPVKLNLAGNLKKHNNCAQSLAPIQCEAKSQKAIESQEMPSAFVDWFSERFEKMIDRIWNLVRVYPQREIQTLSVLLMLRLQFPIYNRLSADTRLCRRIEIYLEGTSVKSPSSSSSTFSNNSSVSNSSSIRSFGMRLSEMGIRERYNFLKSTNVSKFLINEQQTTRLKLLRQKCDQLGSSQANRLRFYTDCGHYEKCVVESGNAKLQLAALRNRLRKCSRCVTRSRFSLSSNASSPATTPDAYV